MPVDPDEYEDQWGSFEFESGGGARQDTEVASFSVEESERYLRGHVLGWGGMGQVWVANDLRLNRDVALKEGSEDGVAQEARITARLEHPGIVPVYDAGRDQGRPWYVMRLIRGRSLQLALSECTTLAERMRYLTAYRAVCNAVAYAHEAGVVHRDLKPDNVMLGEFGETQVVDWGLAMPIDPPPDPQPPMGTPVYMSPEQFEGMAPDPRCDVWSLGVILYELLSGEPPFASRDPVQVRIEVMHASIPPLDESVPPELAAIAMACLRKDPDERYDTALGIARDIDAWLQGRYVGVHEYTPRELMLRFLRVWRVQLTAAALALAVIAMVGAVSYARVRDARDAAVSARHDLLVARSSELFEREARGEAEIFAALALLDRESPIARGVLAGFGAQAAPRRVGTVKRPCARPVFVASDAVVCRDKDTLSRWVWGSDTPQWTVTVDPGEVHAAPGARALVVAHPDRSFTVLEQQTGAVLRGFQEPTDAFLIDVGDRYLSINARGRVDRVDLLTGERLEGVPCGPMPPQPLPGSISPEGSVLQCHDGALMVEGGSGEWVVKSPSEEPRELATTLVRLDGERVLLAYSGRPMEVVGTGDGALLRALPAFPDRPRAGYPVGHSHAVVHVGTSGAWLLGTRSDYRLQLPLDVTAVFGDGSRTFMTMGDSWERWELSEPMDTSRFSGASGFTRVAESPDGRWLGTTHGQGVTLYDRSSGEAVLEVEVGNGVTKDGDFSADGTRFVAEGMHRQRIEVDLQTRTATVVEGQGTHRRLRALNDDVWVVLDYSSQGPKVGPAGAYQRDGTTTFHDVGVSADRSVGAALDDREDLWRISAEGTERIAGVGPNARAVDAHSASLFAIGRRSDLSWGPTGVEQRVDVDSTVMDVAFDPQGALVASGHVDGSVRVWSVSEAALVAVIHGHAQLVSSVEFSSDGLRLMTASWDRTVRVWDVSALNEPPQALLDRSQDSWGRALDDVMGR